MSKTLAHDHLLSCDEMLTLGMPVSEFLEALEDDLGPEAVWELTGAYGGRVLHMPKREWMKRSIVAEKLSETIIL